MVSSRNTDQRCPPVGVLVMAYGTPAGLDQVETYYTHIRHGRKPTPELLADLLQRSIWPLLAPCSPTIMPVSLRRWQT